MLRVLEAGKPKIKVQAEDLLPRWLYFCCDLTWRKGWDHFRASLIRALIIFMRAAPHALSTLKVSPPDTITFGG